MREYLTIEAKHRENELFATEYAAWMSSAKVECRAQKMEHRYMLRVMDTLSFSFNLFMNSKSPEGFVTEYVKRRQKTL